MNADVNLLSITDTLVLIKLQELAGFDATVCEVRSEDGLIHFALDTKGPCELRGIGMVCTLYGIIDGKLEGMISSDQLDRQLELKNAFNRFIRSYKAYFNEDPQTGTEG